MKCGVFFEKARGRWPMTMWVEDVDFEVLGKGFPVWWVATNGFTFYFSGLKELDECVRVLGQKLLERPGVLAKQGTNLSWTSNKHWLSRLPAKVKTWKFRQRAVADLKRARGEFDKKETF